MRTNHFSLPELAPTEFSISYSDGHESHMLNHNETHIHKECEIYLNLSGDVSFEVENRIYPVSRGTVIITRPYEYHHCILRSSARHSHYWITFSAEHTESFLKLFFDREKGNGIVYFVAGLGSNPAQYPGRYSAFYGFEEALLTAAADYARFPY